MVQKSLLLPSRSLASVALCGRALAESHVRRRGMHDGVTSVLRAAMRVGRGFWIIVSL